MRKGIIRAAAGMLIFAAGMAWAQKTLGSRQPVPVIRASQASQTTVSLLQATPSSIPFTANSPGSTITAGSVATVTWNVKGGKNNTNWSLSVGTTSSSFSGCTTVPESAVSVACVSASVDGGGQVSAACNSTSSTTLPNTLPGLQVAGGNEGNGSSHNYTVVLSYQLMDSWRFVANTCPLTVTYTVTVP